MIFYILDECLDPKFVFKHSVSFCVRVPDGKGHTSVRHLRRAVGASPLDHAEHATWESDAPLEGARRRRAPCVSTLLCVASFLYKQKY